MMCEFATNLHYVSSCRIVDVPAEFQTTDVWTKDLSTTLELNSLTPTSAKRRKSLGGKLKDDTVRILMLLFI